MEGNNKCNATVKTARLYPACQEIRAFQANCLSDV